MSQFTHVVQLGGESIPVNPETYQAVADALVERHGGVPKVIPYEQPASAPPLPSVVEDGQDEDTERAKRDERLAIENGFVVRPPLFSIGTKVNSIGVDNARRSQVEHEEKPYAVDLATSLVEQVREEKRQDLPVVRLAHLRMTTSGKLAFPDSHQIFAGTKLLINDRIFAGLMSRMPCASGTAYLSDCPTKLRSINFNHWATTLDEQEIGLDDRVKEVVVRTRKIAGSRVAYAAVSPKYTPFDADKIGEALKLAFPSDARGSLDYDGERFRIEGLWHSDVQPERYVAGEIFKAGVIVTSGDVGGHAIRVQSVIWRNLCRNLIILDNAIGVDIRLRHMGTVSKLAQSFRDAFSKALTSVDAFRRAWTYARNDEGRKLIEAVQGTTNENLSPLPIESVLPGIMNGILQRELVPVRGRRDEVLPKLLEMHRADEAAHEYGVSRASIVNAFTRYAHEVETDPFRADEIRQGAGALLSGSKGRDPEPLPYVAAT